MWLTIVTMTTVGYGDFSPKSGAGQVIVCVLTVCSTLYMAIPLGIIGHNFSEIWRDRDRILLVRGLRDQFTVPIICCIMIIIITNMIIIIVIIIMIILYYVLL